MGDAGPMIFTLDEPFRSATRPFQRKLKVGIVGIGRVGRRHALNILQRTPRATLVCACSPAKQDLIWADEHLKPYDVEIFTTFEHMMQYPGLEALIVASPAEFHLEQTKAALDKGIHVLCEKPVCATEDELKALVERIEAKPTTKLMVAFVRRFDADYREASLKIQSGAIGKALVIRSMGCERVDTSPAYKQYLKASGGIFVDSIIHDIDLSLFLLGEESEPKSVASAGLAAVHEELTADGDADNAVGICEFWNGKIAFFHNSRTAVRGYDNATEIYGTKGKISINMVPRRSRVELSDEGGFNKVEPTDGWYDRYSEAFAEEVNAWVGAVLEDVQMPVPLKSSLKSLRIALALQESLATGKKIYFDQSGQRLMLENGCSCPNC